MLRVRMAVVLSLLVGVACASGPPPSSDDNGQKADMPSDPAPSPPASSSNAGFVLQIGDDLAPAVKARVVDYIAKADPAYRIATPDETIDGEGGTVLAIGETKTSRALITDDEVAKLGPEGYVLRASAAHGGRVVVRGSKRPPTKGTTTTAASTRATAFGAYAALEQLGFAFLHPLAPTRALALTTPALVLDRHESPRWPTRGIQLHTMHPLELTNLLQGWGVTGPEDANGWQAMLPEWDTFLEWMLANGLNQVHWVLLEADAWKTFAMSETRRQRLTELVARAHAFGITVGADVPIVLKQQNTFRLIEPTGNADEERAQLKRRVDWLMSTGYDYVATENGTTEFTHVDAHRMLGWMNDLTKHVGDVYGKPTYVKLHCSTGQKAEGFIDPATGQPINYNYLPHFADPRLGVLPHTVQHYGLDDPAPTYGNTDFGYVRDFLRREVGRREVLWHPETAYWVSFDVDVPLFLPVYADRRVHDLRLLAADEDAGRMGVGEHAGKHMDGQNTFSSGWEWGYWLNDVVTARASWNPHTDAGSDEAALREILADAFTSFASSSVRDLLVDLIVETAYAQRALLIEGRVANQPPASGVVRKNGQAYLQGFETWDDVSDLGSKTPGISPVQMTQPARLGLVEMRLPVHPGPRYTGEVELLLAEMESRFDQLANKWDTLRAVAKSDLIDDLSAAMTMTSLRSKQVHGLYDYVDQRNDIPSAPRLARLATARKALDDAAVLVKAREPHYRVPADRISSWALNPTAYHFGYLWSVRSLYYWWRDEGQAVDAPRNPCYQNVLSMTDVGLGEGAYTAPANILRAVLGNDGAAECLSAPSNEPSFPQLGLRTRP